MHSIGVQAEKQERFTIPDCETLLAAGTHSTALEDDLGFADGGGVPEGLRDVGRLFAGGRGDGGASGRPSGSSESGPLSNTPLTNRQSEKPVAGIASVAGLDWLEWCSFGWWDAAAFYRLRKALDAAREEAQRLDQDVPIDIGGDPVRVKSTGVRRGLYCRWCLEWQGVEVAIVDCAEESSHAFSVHLIARSLLCMDVGVGVYSRAAAFLERLGYHQSRTVVSRVDLAVDLVGVKVGEFVDAFRSGAVVRRARKSALYFDGGRCTGLVIGKAEVMLRVYDKFLEAMVSADVVKREVLIERRWGGQVPSCATRVEFQLKREALRVMGFDEVPKLLGNLKSVSEWLTGEWCRFTDGVSDRSHTDRCEPSALWRRVTDALVVAFRSGVELPIEWRRKLQGDPLKLLKQAAGCLSSALALRAPAFNEFGNVVARLPATVEECAEAVAGMLRGFVSEVLSGAQRKRALLATEGPFDVWDRGGSLGRFFGGSGVFT
jgi:hypothetical protein